MLRDFYAAINARDYARAYAAWATDGPPGHPTVATFAAGYATTDSVRLTVGSPGRVGGAAGSRYLDVPIRLLAYQRDNRVTEYSGTYTLRRTVVPGADAASQRWHLYGANLRAASVKPP